MMKKNILIWIGSAVMIIVAMLLGFMSFRGHVVRVGDDGWINIQKEKKYWSGQIRSIGGKAAYEQFAVAVRDLTPAQQHSAAHVFGESLFETVALSDAIDVCDARFTMGCFHSLFGSAATFMGTQEFVRQMQSACSGRTSAMQRLCLHGIGHGILGSLGYDVTDLVDALTLCEQIPDAGNITTGCWGGAFMEFNVQTLVSLETPARPLNDTNLFEPCTALAQDYKPSCMFWQPTWWHVALRNMGSEDEKFARMGRMCASQSKNDLARACVRGIGFRAAWTSGYDASRVAQLCSNVGAYESRVTCWKSAELDLPKRDVIRAAPSVCEGLDSDQRDACLQEVQGRI